MISSIISISIISIISIIKRIIFHKPETKLHTWHTTVLSAQHRLATPLRVSWYIKIVIIISKQISPPTTATADFILDSDNCTKFPSHPRQALSSGMQLGDACSEERGNPKPAQHPGMAVAWQ